MKLLPFGVRDEPMSKHTSLRIGGPADYFVRVTSSSDNVQPYRFNASFSATPQAPRSSPSRSC